MERAAEPVECVARGERKGWAKPVAAASWTCGARNRPGRPKTTQVPAWALPKPCVQPTKAAAAAAQNVHMNKIHPES
eukprot:scaffold33788_cov79-Isochrysis_galbana.AAC.1